MQTFPFIWNYMIRPQIFMKSINAYALFHRAQFPLITVEFTGVKENAENFKDYLDGLEVNYHRKESFALIFDARQALSLNPKYQLKQAAWMQKHKALIEQYCLGVAYVVPQNFLRNVLQVIFKITPNPVPFKVFEKMDEGEEWANRLISSLV